MQEVAARLKVDPEIITPGVDGLVAAGMVEEVTRGTECDLTLTPLGLNAIDRLTEARRGGLTELLEGWNLSEHPEVIEMVKQLAASLMADDARLVADAQPRPVTTTELAQRRRPSWRPAAWSWPDHWPRARRAPMSAAPSTGGAETCTSCAPGATAVMPWATRDPKPDVGGVEDAAAENHFHRLALDARDG